MHTPEDMSQTKAVPFSPIRSGLAPRRLEAEHPLSGTSPDPDLVGPSLEAILCGLVSAERCNPERAGHSVGEVGGAAHDEACVLYGRQCLRAQTSGLQTAPFQLPMVLQPTAPCAGRLTSPNVREHVTELHCRFLHALQCYVECSKTVTQGTDRSPLKVSIYLMQSRGMPD